MHRRDSSVTRLSAAIAVALAAGTVACGDAPAPTSPGPSIIQSRLVGTVTESTANGPRPLEGAVVTDLASGRSVTTNHAGTYSIHELPDGFATIRAIKDGYESVTRSLSLSGETRLDLQLVPRREPLPPSVLWGVVYERTASSQMPVAGVHVEDSNLHMSSKTDAEGRYRLDFSGIDRSSFDGFVSLYVAKEGYRTISRWEMAVTGERLDIEIVRR
jgi:hypothetical protein